MNWLITGGCGFIGIALIRSLLEQKENRIRIVDNLSVGSKDDLIRNFKQIDVVEEAVSKDHWGEKIQLCVGDIRDQSHIDSFFVGADVVVHLAANTGVGPSVDDPMSDCVVNVVGTLNVLESCRKHSVGRFIFASSGAPLGVQTPPLNENMAPHPASPYGASKLAGEGYCSAYFHCFGVETVALRFGNVYGEGSENKSSVVAQFIKRAIAKQDLEIYGDGKQTRDFIYIEDLVRAIVCAASKHGVGGEVFQIATSSETSVNEITTLIVSLLSEELGYEPNKKNTESRQGDVARNYSDTTKAKKMLGWEANIPLEIGLQKTIRSFL